MARTRDLWKDPARRGHGKRWLAVWAEPGGRERTMAFAKKIDAGRHGTAMEASQPHGYYDPRQGKITVGAYAEQRWLPSQVHLRPNSVSRYASDVATHIVPLLGDRPLGALRRPDCTAFVAALLAKPLAPSTVHTVYAVLRSLMQSAVADQLIPANPCSRVPLPRVDKPVVVPLAAEAVTALAAAMPPRYELAVWLAAGAGLREGEALGLTVPRVEFLARRLAIVEQMQNKVLSPLKTRASRRVVPADDLVLSAVTAHMQRWAPGPWQLLITNRLGRPVQRNSFGDCWREAVKAAGLPAGTRYHGLRHFYSATLIAAGLHPKVIQERLGHATIAETMDTYGHLFPSAGDLGRGAVDAALRNALAEQGRNRDAR